MNISSLLHDVTDRQREAITHVEGPLLIVAGAGSGKTRVITRRIGYLMTQGVNPYNILAITFTNKAADEMHERIQEFAPYKGLWVSTFHKMCSRILRSTIDRIGYSRDFTIYDTADHLNRIKSIMTELQLDTTHWKSRTIAGSISNAKNKLINPENFVSTASGYYDLMVAKIYSKYQTLLKNENALDFDDLLIKTIELFKNHSDVLGMYQDKFRFILIDEYQDTNYAQYTLTRLLANKYRNICVTGDPDQSIYGWRGADIRNIMDFEKDYADARVVLLEQNYRSTKHILHAASSVIQQNRYRKEKGLWTENMLGEKIKVIACEDERGEADEITKIIRGLIQKGFKYSDIAIFYRTNAQSRVLEISLGNQGIPYTIIGGVEFYQRKEIKDILSYLRLSINPHDTVALERTINTPTRGIGNTTLKKLEDWAAAQHISLFQTIQQVDQIPEIQGKAAQAIKKYAELIVQLQQLPKSPVEHIIRQVIDKTNYLAFLREPGDKESKDRIANVEEMVNAAHEYDANGFEGALQGFLEEVALVSDADDIKDNVEVVTLMTLHTAKGLEFPVVFITGMEDGLLPHTESRDSDDELEEERRLCYVGITRAMKELFLSHAARRMRYGQTLPSRASRFLDEIPHKIIEKIDRTNHSYSFNTYTKRKEVDDETTFKSGYDTRSYKSTTVVSDSHDVCGENNLLSLAGGDVVRHPIFGVGRVLEVSGSNENVSAKVSFNVGGTKNLMLAYAKLEKIR